MLRLLDSYPARKQVSLDVMLGPDLPAVFDDRVQLQQLVLNLMLNALEALEPVSGRAKKLSVRSRRLSPGCSASASRLGAVSESQRASPSSRGCEAHAGTTAGRWPM